MGSVERRLQHWCWAARTLYRRSSDNNNGCTNRTHCCTHGFANPVGRPCERGTSCWSAGNTDCEPGQHACCSDQRREQQSRGATERNHVDVDISCCAGVFARVEPASLCTRYFAHTRTMVEHATAGRWHCQWHCACVAAHVLGTTHAHSDTGAPTATMHPMMPPPHPPHTRRALAHAVVRCALFHTPTVCVDIPSLVHAFMSATEQHSQSHQTSRALDPHCAPPSLAT
jgi:hypothetical protein